MQAAKAGVENESAAAKVATATIDLAMAPSFTQGWKRCPTCFSKGVASTLAGVGAFALGHGVAHERSQRSQFLAFVVHLGAGMSLSDDGRAIAREGHEAPSDLGPFFHPAMSRVLG